MQDYTYPVCMQERVQKPQRMVRKQILITTDQSRRLKARAVETGLPETELVRRGIELALTAEQNDPDDWRDGLKRFLAEGEPLGQDFAERMRGLKRADAAAWRKRLARTRRALNGE